MPSSVSEVLQVWRRMKVGREWRRRRDLVSHCIGGRFGKNKTPAKRDLLLVFGLFSNFLQYSLFWLNEMYPSFTVHFMDFRGVCVRNLV